MFEANYENYQFTASERFLRYVTIDTQSDSSSDSSPSTEKQKNLLTLLDQELKAMGIAVELDDYGYLYAYIPSTIEEDVPGICFCSHVDTSPDCSGTGVKPLLHKNYQGADIVLPDDPSQVISVVDFPQLQSMIGHDIITASGTTLLGADDKAGVAEIMDFAHYLVTHPDIKHGPITLLFTPDEEIGRGTAHIDMKKIQASFGYTVDGGAVGTIEDENFNADSVTITIYGVAAHPGYAKGKLINALKVAADLLMKLPTINLTPESTSEREGFIHPVACDGNAERCTLVFIMRDFSIEGLEQKNNLLRALCEQVVNCYPKVRFDFNVKVQYRNMKQILDQHPELIDYAKKACDVVGVKPILNCIRGGTDGALLSFLGLPCANIFAGQHGIHSQREFISVQDMNSAVMCLVELAKIWGGGDITR